jgi:hypothetical protein
MPVVKPFFYTGDDCDMVGHILHELAVATTTGETK